MSKRRWKVRKGIREDEIPIPLRDTTGIMRLPKPQPTIYFLLLEGKVVYVGQTIEHLPLRIQAHRRDKEFDDVLYYHCSGASCLLGVEAMWIRVFRPRYNNTLIREIPPEVQDSILQQMVEADEELERQIVIVGGRA